MPRKPKPERRGLAHQLRAAIEARGLTNYAIGHLAGVDPGVVSRFMADQRDIRLETADRIAGALGLRLADDGRRKAPGRRRPDPGFSGRRRGGGSRT